MTHLIYIPIIVGLVLGGMTVFFVQRAINRNLRESREAIEIEEKRMFDFLHGLGEALSGENATNTSVLHRLIVQGAAMVAESHGGSLYLLDRNGETLVPHYRSLASPPLIAIPSHIEEQARKQPSALDSYLRLTSVKAESGILGWCFNHEQAMKIDDLSQETRGDDAFTEIHRGVSAMLATLRYGDKRLGVLAVANSGMGQPFSANDFEVFKSVAEQSAFALGTAMVHHEASDKRLLDNELQVAREVQNILLPSRAPDLEDYRLAGTNLPAKVVSGDYFDYIEIDATHYGVLIADVSGKGAAASIIMAMCRSVVRSFARDNHSPADVLDKVNRALYPDIRLDMFISLAYVVLDRHSNEVVLARAGHDPPLYFSMKTGAVTQLEPPGMALGIDDGDAFARATRDFPFRMEAGDALLLYTDGANEALDMNDDEFGMERLRQDFQKIAPSGAEATVSRIVRTLRDFTGTRPQNDDITLIAIEKR
jgi:sigma-B regulation protein RsbU (phosphoserine phosphatase)